MAAALLAALFAFGVFSPQGTPGVSAHDCTGPSDTHEDNADDPGECNQPGSTDNTHESGDHIAPVFSMETYKFGIDENKPGSGADNSPVSLGRVMATHAGDESFNYTVSDTDNYRIYASGELAYIGAAPGLDFEDADILSDDDGKYFQITVTATEVVPTGGSADDDPTGTAMVRIYVNDVEADPPAGVMGDPIMGDPDGMTVKWTGRASLATPDTYQVQFREKDSGDDWEAASGTITTQPLDGDNDAATPDAPRPPEAGDDKFQVIISTGLEEKTDYEVRVRYTPSIADVQPPTNAEADDGWSTGMGETVSVPAAVKIAVTSEGQDSGELMVSWTNDDAESTMHDGGGDSEAMYKVEYGERRSFNPDQDNTLRSFETGGSSTTIGGLDNGTLYHVRVTPSNRVFDADDDDNAATAAGLRSDPMSDTPYGEPSAPRNLQVVAVSQTALLANWQAPDDMGGYASVNYDVTYQKVGDASTSMTMEDVGATSASISGLEANTLYQVQVMATNLKGDSQPAISFGRTVMAPAGPPAIVAPSLVRDIGVQVISDTEIFVSWNAPASNGGSDITGYSVQYRVIGTTSWMTVTRTGAAVGQTITGLTANTAYVVRVAAMNYKGTGDYVLAAVRTMDGPAPPPDPCLDVLSSDGATTDHWTSGCDSVDRVDRSARFYTFTLTQDSEVTITLESTDADAYLYLRMGEATSGTAVNDHVGDDDAGEGTNSQMKESLTAGTYTIEATTFYAGETGSFTLTLSGVGITTQPDPPPADPCLDTLSSDGTTTSQWASGCDSVDRAGSHARFYTFTLTQESAVTITLESDDADAYLYLRLGETKSGTAVNDHVEDDDAGEGTNSQIKESLTAGTYTIEATTYYAGETGSFTLTLSGVETTTQPDPPPADPCLDTLSSDGTTTSQWASGCESVERAGSHARFYTFTLPQESEVTITLESDDADAYLYLRLGEAKSGTAVNDHVEDDDAGAGTNSQIKESLTAGTYTIEATTYYAGETGSFTLTLSGVETFTARSASES